MTISVIIPVYNEEQHIQACLKSLLSQSTNPAEIIVVDDGSTDQTANLVKQFPVTLITVDHQGPGTARNLAAKSAKGEILVFVDADMVFDKQFLKHLTAPVITGQEKGVYNYTEYVGNWDSPLARCWNYNQNNPGKLMLDPNSPHQSEDFRAILKKEFIRVGGFDLTGYTDSRTLVAKLGYRPTPVKAVSYHHNPSSLNEVALQANWIGKRKTKLGTLGKLINLIRYSVPLSLTIGIFKSIYYHEPAFFIFKLVYDFDYSLGTIKSLISNNLNK